MTDIKVAISSESVYRRAVGYTYQQVVSEYVKVRTTKAESEKVTNMVGTFLKEDGITYQQAVSELV